MDGIASQLRRKFDPDTTALEVVHALESMQPMDVPAVLVPSAQLEAVLRKRPPESVPKDLVVELEQFSNSRIARANAKGENERRLRTLLWAEQHLRARDRQEHELLRAFNHEAWGVYEPAPIDPDAREALVKAHA